MKWEYEINSKDKDEIKESINSDMFILQLNNNMPYLEDKDEKLLEQSDKFFSDLDDLNRCGVAFSRITNNTISHGQKDRPNITSAPTGYSVEEDNPIDSKSIFERCHLIGYHLFAKRDDNVNNKNANLKRIFTGTRFMNKIMFYFENKIADYVDGTENSVLYRVTPYFEGNNELAYGVQMEAKFVKRNGEEDKNLSFNIFVYNKQPCIRFDYETGKDLLEKRTEMECRYIIDKKKKKFHIYGCASTWDFDDDRKSDFYGQREDLIRSGYHPCDVCDPGIRK